MKNDEFTYRAYSRSAVRTFLPRRAFPLITEFFAIRYTNQLYKEPHTAGFLNVVARLPWQDLYYAQKICLTADVSSFRDACAAVSFPNWKQQFMAGQFARAERERMVRYIFAFSDFAKQRHGIDRLVYVRDVLQRLPTMTNQDDIDALTPAKWKPATS